MLVTNPNDFDYVKIGLTSPERIRFWSYGEVKKPETINYRTFRPERNGLFCERIFGPVKDYECSCGKYRRIRYRGIVCDRCGVEVTSSKVRRERMGHIELAAPITHIWFFGSKGGAGRVEGSFSSYIGALLNLSYKELEKVVYYDSYIVTEVDPSVEELEAKQLLSEKDYMDLKEKYKDKFKAGMGGSAIREALINLDLRAESKKIRKDLQKMTGQNFVKASKRLSLIESFIRSGNRPEWMVMDVIPVMPPDLRPMVQLEGGRFATSDVNDLYRRVINRNNRLKRLLDIGAPSMIIRNEKRMLQEAVDTLFDNGLRGRSVTGTNGRPLKSIADVITGGRSETGGGDKGGKEGRFRKNLLGKRVDYSGRSVIVVGPSLKLHQTGLPKEMAVELFKPFIIRQLISQGFVQNVKIAKRKIENRDVEVYDVLDQVIEGRLVLLNRAPTLHRLGIQAFEPVLVEGKAIQLHPLVCSAYNADFDGDQMAVHVPLSLEAQAESRMLMLSSNNILSPATGKSLITPSQDMVIGMYYMTLSDENQEKGKGKLFSNEEEAIRAYEADIIAIQALINVRINGQKVETTVGRVIFNNAVNDILDHFHRPRTEFINKNVDKGALGKLIAKWFNDYGSNITAVIADTIKTLGFHYATKAGISIAVSDLLVPESKKATLEWAHGEISKLDNMLDERMLSKDVHMDRSFEIWRQATGKITEDMQACFGIQNNIYMMANSGARGNVDQVRQLAAMRGLMADAKGNTVKVPITSNFQEGLSLTEYFISSYGARKGVVDTAENTAKSGFLTRRFVDVAQDTVVTSEDCGTNEGISILSVRDDNNDMLMQLHTRARGRYTAEKIVHPKTGEVILQANKLITDEITEKIKEAEVERIKIRSVLTCCLERGVCKKCYGIDLSRNKDVELGEAVGIIAGQSIGEPGTQLTMRTFHTGGADLSSAVKEEAKAKHDCTIKYGKNLQYAVITNENGDEVSVVTQKGELIDEQNKEKYYVRQGTTLIAADGQKVKQGDVIAEYSHSYEYVISEKEGTVKFIGIDPGATKDHTGNRMIRASEDDMLIVYRNDDKVKKYEVVEGMEKLLSVEAKLASTKFKIVRDGSSFEVFKGKESAKVDEVKISGSKLFNKEESLFVYELLKEFIVAPVVKQDHEGVTYTLKYGDEMIALFKEEKKLAEGSTIKDVSPDLSESEVELLNAMYEQMFVADSKYVASARLDDFEYSVVMVSEGYDVYKNGHLVQHVDSAQELDPSKYSIEYDHIKDLFKKLPKRSKIAEASERLFNSLYSLKRIKYGFAVYRGKKIAQVLEANKEESLYNEDIATKLNKNIFSEKEIEIIKEGIASARKGTKEITAEKGRRKFTLSRVDGWFELFKNKTLLQVMESGDDLDISVLSEELEHVKNLFQKIPVREVSAESSMEMLGITYQVKRAGGFYEIYKDESFLKKITNENHLENELMDILAAKELELVKDLFQVVKRKIEFLVDKTKSQTEDGKEQLIITTVAAERYNMVEGEHILVLIEDEQKVKENDILVIKQVRYERARDIVAGLPKVDALFDAVNDSKRVEFASFSEVDGVVEISERGDKRTITIKDSKTGKKKKSYDIYWWTKLRVYDGQKVSRGEQLTEGTKRPQDVLKFLGVKATQQYLLDDIQKAYLSQGVSINDKHIEIIIRRMTVRVRVIDIGDSPFQIGEFVNRYTAEAVNKKLKEEEKTPARLEDVVLGIRRAALNTESFFSAASFTDTRSVLTNAAVSGKIDPMLGLKENVIIGKLIPAGTGIKDYSNIKLHATDEADTLEPVAETLEEEIFSM